MQERFLELDKQNPRFKYIEKIYYNMKKRDSKKDFKKSGQISVFIIISILVVAVIVIFIIINENINVNTKVSPEIMPVYSSVQECIKKTAENGVYYIGQTGGYFTKPTYSTIYDIAYYSYQGKNIMPSRDIIEKELDKYMEFMLPFCNQNFLDYQDFKIKTGEIKTNSKIEKGKVTFNVVYPLTISKNNRDYFVEDFGKIEIPVRLDEIYDLAYNITQSNLESEGNICISCIYAYATKSRMFVEINDENLNLLFTEINYTAEKGTTIFAIRDPESSILNSDYIFYFADKK